MKTQAEKAETFQALHHRDGAFIIPNPYDAGTARLLTEVGFEALATTSAGFAHTLGKADYGLTRDQVLAHAREIVSATELPVSADLEGGFGDGPQTVADTFRFAAATGLVGGSIEDSTNRSDEPIYDIALAVERVQAAADVVSSLPFPFMLTARCENYLVGRTDLKETITRLQAYQEAGASVLYAPGLTTKEDIAAVVSSVHRPVNVLIGFPGMSFTLAELSEIGVKRVSIGSGLSTAAMGAVLRAAREMHEHGTFTFKSDQRNGRELTEMLSQWTT